MSLGEGENGGLLKGDLPWMQRIFDLRCAKYCSMAKNSSKVVVVMIMYFVAVDYRVCWH